MFAAAARAGGARTTAMTAITACRGRAIAQLEQMADTVIGTVVNPAGLTQAKIKSR